MDEYYVWEPHNYTEYSLKSNFYQYTLLKMAEYQWFHTYEFFQLICPVLLIHYTKTFRSY